MILLDADIMVDIHRGYRPAVEWLKVLGDEEVLLPGYVVFEILAGAGNKREMNRIQRFVQPFLVQWPSSDDCDRALVTFARTKLSHNLGSSDALIAETAKGLGLPLYTFNVRHYRSIPDLKTVQPYRRAK